MACALRASRRRPDLASRKNAPRIAESTNWVRPATRCTGRSPDAVACCNLRAVTPAMWAALVIVAPMADRFA